MFYYRGLPRRERFKCRECGKRDYGNYFLTPTLCKSCGAKRRSPNVPVNLTNNLVVTKAVEKRLRKKAEGEIPQSRTEKVGERISRWGMLFFWASGYFVARAISDAVFPFDEWTALFWYAMLVWCFGLPWANMVIIDRILARPKKEREERVGIRMAELAEERKEKLEEQERFYSSPEWVAIRKQVIEEEGRVCAECGKKIKNNNDMTIDHKYPRSKYPDLALRRENLRVLCRRCNSRKGSHEWFEI